MYNSGQLRKPEIPPGNPKHCSRDYLGHNSTSIPRAEPDLQEVLHKCQQHNIKNNNKYHKAKQEAVVLNLPRPRKKE